MSDIGQAVLIGFFGIIGLFLGSYLAVSISGRPLVMGPAILGIWLGVPVAMALIITLIIWASKS